LLGATHVRGVDLDGETVAVAEENARLNGVLGRVRFGAGSVGETWPWPEAPAERSADVVLANISSVVIGALMPLLAAAVRPGGALIASGFLTRDAHEVRAAVLDAGLHLEDETSEGTWGALTARQA